MSVNVKSHIVLEDDGTATGAWGPFVLKSAFQPIFAFERGKLAVTAFEALLRPFRDDRVLTPATFFAGLTAADRIAVENVSHTLHIMNAATCLPPEAAIFLNFDPSVFIDHAVAEAAIREMRVVLAARSVDPHRVVCEVTEKGTVSEEALFALVGSLRDSGFRIAVDDYGADDSDMRRIRGLRPDIVKFDGEWITRLMDSGPGFALLATMAATFAEQGIQTVFEGLEEGWQIELAEKAGVAMVQGFALGRPQLAPAAFSEFRKPDRPDVTSTPASAAGGPVRHAAAGQRQAKAFGRRKRIV